MKVVKLILRLLASLILSYGGIMAMGFADEHRHRFLANDGVGWWQDWSCTWLFGIGLSACAGACFNTISAFVKTMEDK